MNRSRPPFRFAGEIHGRPARALLELLDMFCQLTVGCGGDQGRKRVADLRRCGMVVGNDLEPCCTVIVQHCVVVEMWINDLEEAIQLKKARDHD